MSLNKNLVINHTGLYQNLPIYSPPEGVIQNYLERVNAVLNHQRQQFNKVLVVRLDLRVPAYWDAQLCPVNNQLITRFIASLQAKLDAKIRADLKAGKRVHEHGLRYVWVREQKESEHAHYHLALLFNGNAYSGLGSFNNHNESNLASKINSAWSSALNLSNHTGHGLVHFCTQGMPQMLLRDSRLDEVIYALSYLCKATTKQHGIGQRSFGCSQLPKQLKS